MAEGKDTGFKDPKVLPCHNYCKHCIFRLALRTGLDKPFSCPECHNKLQISSLNKLNEAKDTAVQEPTLQTCKKHEQPMSIYCFDCGCYICRHCTIIEHEDHRYEFVKKAALTTKEKLSQHLEPLRQTRKTLSCAVREIQTTRSEVEAQGHSVANCIENSFDELHQIIEQRKHQLLAESAKETTRKLGRLSDQEKSVSTACAVLQSVIEYTEQCVEHSADDEVMCLHAELEGRIDREIEQQQKQVKNLEPVEELDMAVEVRCVEDLKKLCWSKAKFYPDITQSAVTFQEVTDTAEVGKMSLFTFKHVVTNGKRRCKVKCHLKSLVNGFTSECEVDLIKGNLYRACYTPTVRGYSKLTVTVNGVAVADGPFPVLVSIHPTQLGKPVRVISNISCPREVALNSAGEIIITHSEGVSIFDKDGKKLRSKNVKNPFGVAVDSTDGCIYVTDNSNILKFSSDLQLISTIRIESVVSGVAVVGQEVMVCDRYNCLLVYDKELKYVRKIGTCGVGPGYFGRILAVSSDEQRNVYVSDIGKSLIHVFNNDGKFLHSFGQDGNNVKRLKLSHGVHTHGHYVYVTNYTSDKVSVFTTAGKYVTSFGNEGTGEGELKHPWGVCVDKDGFVYVCDNSNNRVQVF